MNKNNTGNAATVSCAIERVETELRNEIRHVSEHIKEQRHEVGYVLSELDNKFVREMNHMCGKQATVINRSLEEVDSRLTELSSENERISEVQELLGRKLCQDHSNTSALPIQPKAAASEDAGKDQLPVKDRLPTFSAGLLGGMSTSRKPSDVHSAAVAARRASEMSSPKTLRISRIVRGGCDLEPLQGEREGSDALRTLTCQAH